MAWGVLCVQWLTHTEDEFYWKAPGDLLNGLHILKGIAAAGTTSCRLVVHVPVILVIDIRTTANRSLIQPLAQNM